MTCYSSRTPIDETKANDMTLLHGIQWTQHVIFILVASIDIKHDLRIDSVKRLNLEFYELIWVNLDDLKKIKILIFYMKKLKINPYKYRLYML